MKLRLKARVSLLVVGLTTFIVLILSSALLIQFGALMVEMRQSNSRAMTTALLAQVEKQGRGLAQFMANALTNPLYQYRMDVIYDLTRSAKERKGVVYVYVYDESGAVIDDGTGTLKAFALVLDDELTRRTLATGKVSTQSAENILHISAPIVVGSESLGGVRLGLSLEAINADMEITQRTLTEIGDNGAQTLVVAVGIGTLFLAALGTLFSVLVARGLSRPVEALAQVTRQIGGGRYDVEIPFQRSDEIGELAVSLKNMAADRKRAEGEIRKLNAELEQRVAERTAELAAANKELEAFTYSVSHDLRAPLRSMGGFSQALLEDYADKIDAEGRGYLQRVRAGSRHMAQLIDDLLTLSRVSRGELERREVDLSKVARTAAAELESTEPDRQVTFDIASGVAVDGDGRLLRIVLENLLGNAWKFTNKDSQAKIEFGVSEYNGQRVYYVRDDGIGFDMAYADTLFEPFQRLHRADEFEGTGIGLATVARIVRRHGGRVWAEAAVGQGATVYFTL